MQLTTVTGATGNVGLPVLRSLCDTDTTLTRAATRSGNETRDFDIAPNDEVRFDFTDPDTYDAAFAGTDSLFLMRPSHISDVEDAIFPAVDAAVDHGVEHIVTLSVMGADTNPFLPHRRLETYVEQHASDPDNDLHYTHIRPGFFMQNLSTHHRAGIRDLDEIIVPAGDGRANFVDTRDVGELAGRVLLEGNPHFNTAYEPTGSQTYDYHQVADTLSDTLDRTIEYTRPGYIRYIAHMKRHDYDTGFVLFSCLLHSVVRFGWSERLTDDVEAVLNRPPRTMRQFTRDHADLWQP
jgi:uncharacterized protein YbjT (DUF2867 family)